MDVAIVYNMSIVIKQNKDTQEETVDIPSRDTYDNDIPGRCTMRFSVKRPGEHQSRAIEIEL